MIKRILVVLAFFTGLNELCAQVKPLYDGMKITKSASFKKGTYSLPGRAGKEYVILIEGSNIVIDFNNAVLTGTPITTRPDQFNGICILVRNGKNITIKNLKARGYKIALHATGVDKLVIENCDFSFNYRKQLNSTQEKEDISDWMSYHHNEQDEWMRYGAAIYLRNCDSVNITACVVTGGQNALMMTECTDGRIMNNDFSFNSGIGIGMYRCSRNTVSFNRVIFNVRGYSHGVYNRGQDSAGILVYAQSSENSFYYNNVTHGGDGFFLWAGQYTMDTGKGGCNNNILYGNDFSYAPTNGIEVTFSSNYIANNRIFECDHGIWGGYSYNTSIIGNQFRDNRIGIAIEHGQRNLITNNVFAGDKTAIRLWSNKLEPSDWGYPKYRDTRSVAYHISVNSFNRNAVVLSLNRSDSLWFQDNAIDGKIENNFKVDSTVTNFNLLYNPFVTGSPVEPVVFAPHGKGPFEGTGKWKGRKNIMITQWGPYNFNYPIIWNTNPTDKGDTMKFDLLGPEGKWKIKTVKGVENISGLKGVFPSTITAIKMNKDVTDIIIELEFTGKNFTSAYGDIIRANTPYEFRFRKYFKPINWEAHWFSIDTAYHNPIATGTLFSPFEKKAPIKTEETKKLEYAWWGGIKAGDSQYKQFATMASAEAEFEKGSYEISLTWDDAVRLYIDEKLVVDEWVPSRYKFDESPNRKVLVNLDGKHKLRLEHVELGGFATLNLKFNLIR